MGEDPVARYAASIPDGLVLEGVFGGAPGQLAHPVTAVFPGGDAHHAWVVAGEHALRVDGRGGAVVAHVVSERHSMHPRASAPGRVVMRGWEGGFAVRAMRVIEPDGSLRRVVLPEVPRRRGQDEPFDRVVVGRSVVLALRGSQLLIADPAEGAVRARVRVTGDVFWMELAPDERSFALWRDGRVELRDVERGSLRWHVEGVSPLHRDYARLEFDPSGRVVLVSARGSDVNGRGSQGIRAFDAADGSALWSLPLEPAWERVRALCVDAGGGRAACVRERAMVFYEPATGTPQGVLAFADESAFVPVVTLAGGHAVVADAQNFWRVSLETGAPIEPADGHHGAVGSLLLSPDGAHLATVDGAQIARVFRDDGRWLATLEHPALFALWLDANTVMTVDRERRARAYAPDGTLRAEDILAGWAIESAVASPDGRAVLAVASSRRDYAPRVLRCTRRGDALVVTAQWAPPERYGVWAGYAADGEAIVLLNGATLRSIVRLDPETLAERRRTELPIRIEVARNESWALASDLGFWALDRAGESVVTRLHNRGSYVRWDLATDRAGPALSSSDLSGPSHREALGRRWAVWPQGTDVEMRDAATGEVRAVVRLYPAGDHAACAALSHDERVVFIGTRGGSVLRVRVTVDGG